MLSYVSIAALIALVAGMTSDGNPPARFTWLGINEALELAPEQKKLIILDVYTDWCGWCKRMDRDVYADSAVGSYIAEHFVAAKMNPEKKGTVRYDGKEMTQGEFGRALGVTGYPATAFFTEKAELITVVPGYVPARDFRLLLQFLAGGHYEKTTFQEFVQAQSDR